MRSIYTHACKLDNNDKIHLKQFVQQRGNRPSLFVNKRVHKYRKRKNVKLICKIIFPYLNLSLGVSGCALYVGRNIPPAPWLVVSVVNLSAMMVMSASGRRC